MESKLERYARQMLLPQIGQQGQERLSRAKVLIVGAGGLGGFLGEFLVRAGVGRVRLVDRDVPALVNLHRQIQFDEEDVRMAIPKAEAAATRLSSLNAQVEVEGIVVDVTARSLPDLLEGVDLVLDGTDNFETRFLVNDACVRAGIPWVYGGVLGTAGIVMAVRPSLGPCLRCLMPELPPPGSQPTCETSGVLSTAVAMVASLQASRALQLLADSGPCDLPVENLLSTELFPPSLRTTRVRRDPECPCCGRRQFDFIR